MAPRPPIGSRFGVPAPRVPGSKAPASPAIRRLGLPPPPKPARGFGSRWMAFVSIATAAAALILLSMMATLIQRHLNPAPPTAPERALPVADAWELPPPPPPPPVLLEPPPAPPELVESAPAGPLILPLESAVPPPLEIKPLDLPPPSLEGLLPPPDTALPSP